MSVLKRSALFTGISGFVASLAFASGAIGKETVSAPVQDVSGDQGGGSSSEPVVIDEAEALAIDAKIYAETFGVPFDEAARRMAIMTAVEGEIAPIESAEGADFAGSYFDNRAQEFSLKVKTKKTQRRAQRISIRRDARKATRIAERRTARKAQRQADRRGRPNVTEAQVEIAEAVLTTEQVLPVEFSTGAGFSLAQLEANANSSLEQLKEISGFQLFYIDVRSNEVVILVDDKSKAPAEGAARAALNVPFRVELRPGGFQTVAFRGGQVPQTASYPRYCMTAFGVRHNTARNSSNGPLTGVVTANHCDGAGEAINLRDPADGRVYPMVRGSFLDDRSGTNRGDIRFLYNSAREGSSAFHFDGSNSVRQVTGTRSRSATNSRSGALNGSFICHLGQSSPGSATYVQSCGEVVSTVAAQNIDSMGRLSFARTGGYFVMVQNTQSGAGTNRTSGAGTLRCYRGDSGGPWFANTIAFGVMSACSWSDVVDGTVAESLYTSTDFFSDLGVTILVN